jgi:choline dehydrogenase-like flavoprotein
MIIDLPTCPAGQLSTLFDVAIVGAGPAGLALATEFNATGVRVVMLESGSAGADCQAEDLNQTVTDSVLGRSATAGRARGLGGTSQLWAGQLLPLSEQELSVNPSAPLNGWVGFSVARMKPYWRRAERFFGTSDVGYEAQNWNSSSPLVSLTDPFVLRFSQFLNEPDMGKRHQAALEDSVNVTVVTRATVQEILTADEGVTGLRVAADPAAGRVIKAKHYVIACGAIETARLLLLAGLGTRRDMVGRCFMEHLGVVVPLRAPSRTLDLGLNSRMVGARRMLPRFMTSTEYVERHSALNAGIGLARVLSSPSPIPALKLLRRDLGSPMSLTSSATRREIWMAAKTVTSHAPQVARAVTAAQRRGHKVTECLGRPALSISVETLPHPENRVVLNRRRDRYGMPVPEIRFKPTDSEWRTIKLVAATVDDVLGRARLGRVTHDTLPSSVEEAIADEHFVPALHHMGTARISPTERTGVVDENCRVHGCANLHVAGAATFPTGGLSNPTHTLVALSIRLADRLKDELR